MPAAPSAPPPAKSQAPTPTPAPPTPPAPKPEPPKPTPAPTPEPPQPSGDDQFGDLDAAFKKQGWTFKDEPKGKEEPKSKEDGKEPKTLDKNAQFRKGYDTLKSDHEKLQAERKTDIEKIGQLEARVKEWEAKGKDTTVLTERLAQLEKDITERDMTIRALKQEESPEFKKNFVQPFNDAAELARTDVLQMQLVNEDGTATRPATWDDFVALYRMPKVKAMSEARKYFGEDAARLIGDHLTEMHRLNYKLEKGREEEKKGYAEKLNAEQAAEVSRREQIDKARVKIDQDLVASVPEYSDPPDDKELAEARNKGYSIMDSQPKTLQQALFKERHVRHRVAAYLPQQLTIARLKAENAELKKSNDELKNPQPGPGRRTGSEDTKNGDDGLSFEDGLRKHMSGVA